MKTLNFSCNAKKVLEKRYLEKDENGRVIETPKELFLRVAKTIAAADGKFDKKADDCQF